VREEKYGGDDLEFRSEKRDCASCGNLGRKRGSESFRN